MFNHKPGPCKIFHGNVTITMALLHFTQQIDQIIVISVVHN